MRGVSFVRHNKLPNVAGRIEYISSAERQEHLYAVYDTAPENFWQDLARENQMDFKIRGTTGKCIEARELIIALPPVYASRYGPEPQWLLKHFTDSFKEKYGVECTAALHHNKAMTNYHIHLIFSERRLLAEPEEKIATRNMYYDPHGRHLRTAKQAKDENGDLLPGYSMIPKGEVYERHIFEKKDPSFKRKAFTEEVKVFLTDIMNERLDDYQKLITFPKNSAYLPTKKIGKNNPKAQEIREQNQMKDKWNDLVFRAECMDVPQEALKEVKTELITKPVRESIVKAGGKKDPAAFKEILARAVNTMVVMVKRTSRMRLETFKEAWGNSLKKFIEVCAEIAKDMKTPVREKGAGR